jgi:hypothetical protein
MPDFFLHREAHERCCDEDYGGSHYHCARCGAACGMMGHTPASCEVARGMGLDRPERVSDASA